MLARMAGSNPLLPQARELDPIEVSRGRGLLVWFKSRHPVLRVALPITLAMGSLAWSWQVIGQDEFLVAFVLLGVFTLLALISLYGWQAWPSRPHLSKLVKICLAVGILLVATYSGLVFYQKKGDKPWSILIPLMKNKRAKEERKNTPIVTPAVYEPFMPLYETYSAELGNAKGEAEPQRFVYHARHQHGIAIWSEIPGVFYLLNPDTQKWTQVMDPDTSNDPKFGDEAELVRQYKPPKGLYPPYSGVAKMTERDPAGWMWLGFREASPHCDYLDAVIRIQEFDGGKIMGGFVRNPAYKEPAGFVLINEGHRWSTRVLPDMQAGNCQDPVARRAKGVAVPSGEGKPSLSPAKPPKMTSAPMSRPSPAEPISVAFLYRDKQIQIHNLTKSEIYIWGTKLGDSPSAIEAEPRVLSPQPYFYFIEGFEEVALKQMSEGSESRTVYYVFVKDKQDKPFTLKCLLWATLKDHTLTVRTQNLGVVDGWLRKS